MFFFNLLIWCYLVCFAPEQAICFILLVSSNLRDLINNSRIDAVAKMYLLAFLLLEFVEQYLMERRCWLKAVFPTILHAMM